MNVLCVVANWPNVVKAKSLVSALDRGGAQVELVAVGNDELDSIVVTSAEVGLRGPDVQLVTTGSTPVSSMAKAMVAFERQLEASVPDWVVVVDDTDVALACALVASRSGARLAHLEAGLRSHDWSLPAELNRAAIDRVSDLLLVPSPDGVNNLRAEGFEEWQIQLVGNTAADAWLADRERARDTLLLAELGVEAGEYALFVIEDRVSTSDPAVLDELTTAAAKVGTELPIVVCGAPVVAERLLAAGLSGTVAVVDRPGYLDTLALHEQARVVVTDSGDSQDLTAALCVPCVTVRSTTERPFTITNGTNRLVPPDGVRMIDAVLDGAASRGGLGLAPAWGGRAGERAAATLVAALTHGGHRRSPAVQLA